VKDGVKSADTGWQVGNLPSGFKKIMEKVRNITSRKEPVTHLVYSDGLLHVSVFVEGNGGNAVQPSSKGSDNGPISVVVRPVADYQVTVMGEVPIGAVQAIAESVSRRR
jgi:sigma-E factor negative regulatory protein RseB